MSKKEKGKNFLKDFKEFLFEYKVFGFAIAIIIGDAIKDLVNSLVNDVLMPVIEVILPDSNWETAILELGPVNIRYGSFLSHLLNFLILAFIIYTLARLIIRDKELIKKMKK